MKEIKTITEDGVTKLLLPISLDDDPDNVDWLQKLRAERERQAKEQKAKKT